MKQNISSWLLTVAVLLTAATGASAQKLPTGNEYRVSNEMEFLAALGSSRTIILEDDTHLNLSTILEEEENFSVRGRTFVSDASAYRSDGIERVVSESVFDGRQLTLVNIHDLTIRGEHDCSIIVQPRYAFVLNFIGCQNINIEYLTLGHTEEGYCSGGVIGMERCEVVTVESCDMYGCGTYGIEARDTQVFRMFRSIIRDCSYGIMELWNVQDAIFLTCDFYRNREFGLIEADAACSQLIFDDCRFAENEGTLFVLDVPIRMEGSEIHHSKGDFGAKDRLIHEGPASIFYRDDNPLSERPIGPSAGIQ